MSLRTQQLLLAFILGFVLMLMATQAFAHDWYRSTQKPGTLQGCCGGSDCFPVEIEEVVEEDKFFILTLTHIRPNKPWLKIGVPYKISKEHAQSAKGWKPGETGYHACILPSGEFRCFFYPTNT
jgi:hypothetical protein